MGVYIGTEAPSDTERPRPSRGRRRLPGHWSLWVAIGCWAAANVAVALAAPDQLPFDWPARDGREPWELLLETNLALIQVLLLMGVVYWLTRRRPDPRVAERAPERSLALRETVGLLTYGALGLLGGFVLARAFGWHPFGLHLAGSLVGTHEQVTRPEVLAWAGYNLVVYAVVPLLYFARRYSPTALGLRSTAPRSDLLVIAVVLVLETWFQVVVGQPALFDLPAGQLVRGASLTFVLYFLGTVLPAMVFVYAILIPRFLRLTGSATATVLCGGLTYAALHLWDAWTVFTSPGSAALSVVFVLFTYLGPGMFKSFLTLRTGNAWAHVWAYHAFSPHTLIDTPHIVEVFRLR